MGGENRKKQVVYSLFTGGNDTSSVSGRFLLLLYRTYKNEIKEVFVDNTSRKTMVYHGVQYSLFIYQINMCKKIKTDV